MFTPGQNQRDYSFTVWYFFVTIAYIVLGAFQDISKYFIWLKPIPVLLLILKLHTVRHTHQVVRLFEYGLFFGMVGDIFLQISGSKWYFNIGVAAFFIGHVCYISAYLKSVDLNKFKACKRKSLILAIVYALILAGAMMTNLHYIWKNIQTMEKIGFSFYSTALSLMSVSALYLALRSRRYQQMKFATVSIFLGSLLFVISDMTLSQRTKNDDIDHNTKKLMSYVVGVTYWLAQFLIGQGAYQISKVPKPSQVKIQQSSSDIKDTIVTSQTITQPLV